MTPGEIYSLLKLNHEWMDKVKNTIQQCWNVLKLKKNHELIQKKKTVTKIGVSK